ncbi:PREDICTED: lisH domain-containing protein ARMC9-like [Priapulus caudatus]|uniref:LisH domain-containing protein ARMC9-like n=1 Tax=Priapulus caudatus TaxID=37621 RepID=A0ABM1EHP0_PRICU|nr:PREDICTED: lisH domain-containing protein ARMC9-like [Priapulus caudatus]
MLGAFDRGQGVRFFQLWREHLPASLRDQESSSRKLEFYLHIYFAIYPLTKNEENNDQNKAKVEDCMKIFKNYIENRGSVLAQTTEFLPYYALPFVKNPASHPSFDVLFKEDWSKHQRTQLESLLTSSMWAHAQPPKLVELFMKSLSEKKDLSRQRSKLNNSLSVAERNLSIALKKYNRLQMDYENLIEISHELVDQLESTVKGLPIEPDYLKQVCDKLFQSRTMRSKRSSDVSENAPGTPRSIQSGNDKFVEHVPLDYSKMKCDLGGTNDRRKALLLQALRWRLTRAPSDHRDKVMTAYVKNDLLGCVSSGTHKIAVLNLLKSSKSEVREYTVRLLNTFASLALGRTHMMQCPELVKTLFLCIRHEQRCISREMMLGTLQKLSLRRVLQSVMIQEGMLEWLVETLRDHDSLSDYTLEYAIALFMNLCLRTAGKYRCEAMPQETLRVLTDLLGHENVEIRPYVNGALYSLLSVPSIREAAHVMSLQEVLEGFRGDSDADMRRQVEYIIRQLNNAEKNETESDIDDDEEDEDDEEDLDTMEADLDKEEVLFPNPSELTGETLLQVEYIAPSSKVKKAKKTQSDTSTSKSEVLRRPTTPRLHNKGLRGTSMASKDFDSLPAMIHRSADFPAIHRNGTVELSCAESHGQGAPLWRQSSSLSLQAGESRRTSPRPSTESPRASKETSPRKPKAIPPRLQDCVSPRLQDSVSPRLQDCAA